MNNRASRLFLSLVLVLTMMIPQLSLAQAVEEKPTALAMTGDLLIARPFMLTITAIGGAVYIASLPFTLLGGNSEEAADVLFIKPATATFLRCLGCTKVGRKKVVKIED